jgi:hypothetical protein
MTWELYEVWQEDHSGHEELLETTNSRKEALSLAKKALNENSGTVTVYRETEDGDYEEIQRLTA